MLNTILMITVIVLIFIIELLTLADEKGWIHLPNKWYDNIITILATMNCLICAYFLIRYALHLG